MRPGSVDFYARLLGLRLAKKTVNQDEPTAYHLLFGDEAGSPGTALTFFEYPNAARGVAGVGMVHRIVWRVATHDAMTFWCKRLSGAGVTAEADDRGLRFEDPEGLGLEITVSDHGDGARTCQASGDPTRLRPSRARRRAHLQLGAGDERDIPDRDAHVHEIGR